MASSMCTLGLRRDTTLKPQPCNEDRHRKGVWTLWFFCCHYKINELLCNQLYLNIFYTLSSLPSNRQWAVAVPTYRAFSKPQGLDFQQCSSGKALPQDEDIMIEDIEGGPRVRNVTTVLGDGNRENRWGRFVLFVLSLAEYIIQGLNTTIGSFVVPHGKKIQMTK